MTQRRRSSFGLHAHIAVAALAALPLTARAAPTVGDVFYIALENHNFTQPSTVTSLQQLQGNTAAPYLNSLITPGNPNAAQVSYASNYTNAGQGEHPSEPNYVWAEAGTNFNPTSNSATAGVTVATSTNQGTITGTTILNDNDPTANNGNILTNVPHLTAQMNAAGVSWKNYQEDYQITNGTTKTTATPLISASGTNGPVNPYNNSTQYNYAVKHNPMAFFSDTDTENVNPISQLATDLTNNTVGRYNWITPDQYNDMHSALNTPFTYKGTTYAAGTDQEAVALGDNFLSIVVPEIMASAAYKNNGAIVIWDDESEDGDTNTTIPEIVISPLAKGNAYDDTTSLTHSSDIKTMEELFGLGSYLNNAIPTAELNAAGTGYNTVASANDLSNMFVPGAIPSSVPEPATAGVAAVAAAGMLAGRRRRQCRSA